MDAITIQPSVIRAQGIESYANEPEDGKPWSWIDKQQIALK